MIYYTGDIHGYPWNVVKFCKKFKLTRDDVIVILGDVGVNYYQNERDAEAKMHLNAVKPTVLCIHGNHEIRPANISSYLTKEWNGGTVWYEEAYPKLLFAKDGEGLLESTINIMASSRVNSRISAFTVSSPAISHAFVRR